MGVPNFETNFQLFLFALPYLMLDANHGYDSVDAIRLANRVEHLKLDWFEEPVPPEDLDGYLAVKASTSIPMAGGECEYTRFGFRDILKAGAIDYLQPDICAAGGLSECKKIADMANAFGVRLVPHVWGTGIGLSAGLQLLSVLLILILITLSVKPDLFTNIIFYYSIYSMVINPEGIIKTAEVNDLGIGRSATDLLRKIQAAQHVAANPNQACPASWKPGDEALTPSLDLVGKR